jgi:hypothetical protein
MKMWRWAVEAAFMALLVGCHAGGHSAEPPGRYVVQTNALGYNVRVDSARLTDMAGVALRLTVSPVAFDACEGFMVVVDSRRYVPSH